MKPTTTPCPTCNGSKQPLNTPGQRVRIATLRPGVLALKTPAGRILVTGATEQELRSVAAVNGWVVRS